MNKWNLHTLFVFLIILTFSFLMKAQENIRFKNYTIDDGLSQSTIYSISQDKLGTLWLGTQDGINRFNGKNFEVFRKNEGYSIASGYINTSIESSTGDLWFGTSKGLMKYDLQSAQFYSFPYSQDLSIFSIAEDDSGSIWVGTAFGWILKFNPQTHSYKLMDGKTFQTKIIAIRCMSNKMVVVSEFEGVLFTNHQFQDKKQINPLPNNSKETTIYSLLASPNHEVVVATSEGVLCFDEKMNMFKPVNNLFSYLPKINIVDALYLSKNNLYVASENSGLYQVTKDQNGRIKVNHFVSEVFQKGSLISNKLIGLFLDDQGVIWINSMDGLSSFSPLNVGFRGVGIAADPKKGLISQNVWGFSASKNKQQLYIATDVGVTCYDRKQQQFYHYKRKGNQKGDYTTLTIKTLENNEFLVGCVDGLYQLSIDSTTHEGYIYTPLMPQNIPRGFETVYTIVPFKKEGQFLVGARGGIALFDRNENTFDFLFHEPGQEGTIGQGACRFIFEMDGNYFTSPSSGRIYKLNITDNNLSASLNNEFSLLNKATQYYFTDGYRENKEQFWFSTLGDGLFSYNINSKEIQHYDRSSGLPNNVIYAVESIGEESNYLWLSTNRGIVGFNMNKNKVYSYTKKDGLMSNEFNMGASFVLENKEIYFGNTEGYNYFKPENVFYKNENIRVYFSGIEVEGNDLLPKEDGVLSENIAFTKRIKLPYNKRSLKLRFFANDLSNPERIEYKYTMTGATEVEEFLGISNELRFSSLAPGTYTIKVFARIQDGSWNRYPASITIEIMRPFWMKWWFYVILLMILGLFIYFRVKRSIESERRRQVFLEMKIADRTREIRNKTDKIEQQKQRLEEQTEALEREKEKSELLLNNVLPKETVSQLKKEGHATARSFKSVSIMFTDFVQFSKIAEKIPAEELITILDKHFRKFDEIIDNNSLEKIKTIGDAYMCAGGVPIRNKTHPIDTSLAAVQIKYYMLQHKEEQIAKGETYWELRIGINTGAVSAGVIGTKRYAYDIWGSAVNHAQRMEKHSKPGKISVTQATFDFIEPFFECKKIGKIKVKSGKLITMYEVISIKRELSKDGKGIEPNAAFHELVDLHYYSKINYYKAERYIMNKLRKELSPKLHYHSYNHSKDVTRQAERIAIEEGITDEDLFLLKSAASYHDAGFVEQYDHNEPIGGKMAAEILPKFGYTEKDIQRIKELIFATEVPHKPNNKLEEIICDADLDYLGRNDFHTISDLLRRELREHGKIDSDRKWDEMQVSFFEQHRYFTKTSIETRLPKKKKNLQEIKQRLIENNYTD